MQFKPSLFNGEQLYKTYNYALYKLCYISHNWENKAPVTGEDIGITLALNLFCLEECTSLLTNHLLRTRSHGSNPLERANAEEIMAI